MKLSSIMSGGIQTVPPQATLTEAARKMASQDIGSLPVCACLLMERRQVRRLLVTDGNEAPVGIVSLGDIALCLRESQSGGVLRKVSEPDA